MTHDQLLAILKLALEYNAAVVSQASLIVGREKLKPSEQKRAAQYFYELGKQYSVDLQTIAQGTKVEEKPSE